MHHPLLAELVSQPHDCGNHLPARSAAFSGSRKERAGGEIAGKATSSAYLCLAAVRRVL
jgi:hypothetical protein